MSTSEDLDVAKKNEEEHKKAFFLLHVRAKEDLIVCTRSGELNVFFSHVHL